MLEKFRPILHRNQKSHRLSRIRAAALNAPHSVNQNQRSGLMVKDMAALAFDSRSVHSARSCHRESAVCTGRPENAARRRHYARILPLNQPHKNLGFDTPACMTLMCTLMLNLCTSSSLRSSAFKSSSSYPTRLLAQRASSRTAANAAALPILAAMKDGRLPFLGLRGGNGEKEEESRNSMAARDGQAHCDRVRITKHMYPVTTMVVAREQDRELLM